MAGDSQKKAFLILTVFISIAAVALTVAAFATDNWVNFDIKHPNNTNTSGNTENNELVANGFFGLFQGEQNINYGFGLRERLTKGKCFHMYNVHKHKWFILRKLYIDFM